MKRRDFLKTTLTASLTLLTAGSSIAFSNEKGNKKVVILHTNDVHSHIDPFPESNRRYGGLGGAARRFTLIKKIRKKEENTILLDAGDVFQGTMYYNYFKGTVDYKVMSLLGYDIGILGNHDFDGAVSGLISAMKFAKFNFTVANYEFSNPLLKNRIKKYIIKDFAGVKIGFFGLGINFEGLVSKENHIGVTYHNVLEVAEETAKFLKKQKGVHAVCAITHLGVDDTAYCPGDKTVAKSVKNIDLIIGGHSHTFLKKPIIKKNPEGREVPIVQVGFGGIWLGKTVLNFKGTKLVSIDYSFYV